MKAKVSFASLLTLVLFMGPAVGPTSVAIGQTQPEIVVLGAERPVVEQSYPPLIGKPQRQGTANINPLLCKQPDYHECDIIKLTMDPQGRYTLYSVKVSLSWPAPRRVAKADGVTDDNVDGNDMTLGVWEPNPAEVDPTYDGKTRGAWTGANAFTHPEVVFVGTDSPEPKEFYLVVNNSSTQPAGAVNKGYTIRAEFVETDLGALPESKKKGGVTTFSYTPPPAKPSGPKSLDNGPEPTETIKVKVPGPDGELVEMEVPIFIKSASAAKAPEDKGFPILPVVLGLIALGGGSFLYIFVWRRRRTA